MAKQSTKPPKKGASKKTAKSSKVSNAAKKTNKLSKTRPDRSKNKATEKIKAVKNNSISETSSKTKSTATQNIDEMLDLARQGIVFDLYGRPELLTSYEAEIAKLPPEYRSHLYIFPLISHGGGYHDTENNYNAIMQILSKKLKKGFQAHIFPPLQHSPTVGVFNSVSNQFIAFGLGRKNRFFVYNAEGLTGKQHDNYLKQIKKYDVAGRIDDVFSNFEELGNVHRNLEEDVEDWDNLTDDQMEMQSEVRDMIEIIKEDIPTLSGEISDISPFDFS